MTRRAIAEDDIDESKKDTCQTAFNVIRIQPILNSYFEWSGLSTGAFPSVAASQPIRWAIT